MRYIALFFVSLGVVASSGCGGNCVELRSEQSKFVSSRTPFQELPDANQVHFAMTLRDSALDKVAQSVLKQSIDSALNLTTKVGVGGGRTIGAKAVPTVSNLTIRADSACDHCVKVSGKIGGKVAVKIPILGEQSVPVNGDMAIVAPLIFDKGTSKDAAIKLNLSEAAKIGKSSLNAKISQLPPTWSKGLQSPIANALLKAVTEKLPDVTVFEFDAPDMGIKGLKVKPTKLVTDAKSRTIFVGLGSNLSGPQNSISPYTKLPKGQDIAFGIHPQLLANAAESLIAGGAISRTYNDDGEEAAGPIAVVPISTSARASKGGAALNTKFRFWNTPNSGTCYWADVDANSTLSVKNGKVKIDLTDFDVKESSLPGIVLTVSKWAKSSMWTSQKRVYEMSLSDQTIDLPDGLKLSISPDALQFVDNGMWVTARTKVR